MPSYKLSYFDLAGRAELIRIIFSAAKCKFEDHRFSFAQWKDLKADMPFGKVPCLFIDGTPLGESGAIIRYLASEFDMNGSNHTQAAYIEMLHGVFSDNYSKLPFSEKDMKLKKEKTIQVHKESIMPALVKIEKKFIANKKAFLIGDKLSYADLKLANNLLITEQAAPECLAEVPELNKLKNRVVAMDGLKQYLAQRPASKYYN